MACFKICNYWVIFENVKVKECYFKLQTNVLQLMILVASNSLRNISPEQSENKKFQDYLEQIQDPLKAKVFQQIFRSSK